MPQARPSRSGKQQQGQNSPNLETAFLPSSAERERKTSDETSRLFISKYDLGGNGEGGLARSRDSSEIRRMNELFLIFLLQGGPSGPGLGYIVISSVSG